MRVFLTKTFYTLVIGFAGFGVFSGWTAVKEFFTHNLVAKTEVVEKVSTVKPDFAHNHPVYSMHDGKKNADDFTFFDTLNDPNMKKMVGLKGKPLLLESVKPVTGREKTINIKPQIKPKVRQVASQQPKHPASLPVNKLPSQTMKSGGFTVQVSSFRDIKYADALAGKLRGKGYPAFVKPAQLPNGKTWYRVYIGKYPDRDSAQLYALDVQMKEAINTMVIQLSG